MSRYRRVGMVLGVEAGVTLEREELSAVRLNTTVVIIHLHPIADEAHRCGE